MWEKPNKNKILENVNIFYTDGKIDFFKAIFVLENGVIIGRIKDNKFINCGFIPIFNIKYINGNKKK